MGVRRLRRPGLPDSLSSASLTRLRDSEKKKPRRVTTTRGEGAAFV
jgi:hypothetical protein